MGFMERLGQGLYAGGGGDLAAYMKESEKKKNKAKKSAALKEVSDAYGDGGTEGTKKLGQILQDNPENEFLVDAVNEFGTLKKTMKELEGTSLFKLPPEKKGGFLGIGGMNDATFKAMQGISTVEDIEELYDNAEEYGKQGIDVQAVMDWYMND